MKILLFLFLASPTWAATVLWVSGTITAQRFGTSDLIGESFTLNIPFEAGTQFTAAVDGNPIFSLSSQSTLIIDNFEYLLPELEIGTFANSENGVFILSFSPRTSLAASPNLTAQATFSSNERFWNNSEILPSSFDDWMLDEADSFDFSLQFEDPNGLFIVASGGYSNLRMITIPEPSAGLISIGGIFFIAARHRKPS